MAKFKEYIHIIFAILISTIIALLFCELVLRIKHHFIPHYDIEMWKYAKTLKTQVSNKKIGHIHKKNKSVLLQRVNIATNNLGQRDNKINNEILKKYDRKFLILGSSVALGWGVEQTKTFSSRLNEIAKKNNKNWIFINGGIGNYNTERYVNNYLENWSDLEVSDIIVNFFVNDTEILLNKKTSFLIKHSHFAVVMWKFINSNKSNLSEENLENYYKKLYANDFVGFLKTKENLIKLKKHCDKKKINCHLINMPDIHQLNPYKLNFINDKMRDLTNSIKLGYYDLLDVFKMVDEKKIWNNYNDPHPNEYAHDLIALNIFKYLNK